MADSRSHMILPRKEGLLVTEAGEVYAAFQSYVFLGFMLFGWFLRK
jgi:hypothetical protein